MPLYDYRCEGCRKSFSVHLTMAEYDKGKVKCPKCRSAKVKRVISGVSVITAKKS